MAQPAQMPPRFLAVDFYCGAGGTTRGLLDAGGYVVAGIDNDPECRKTYRYNNPNENLDRLAPLFLEYDMFTATNEYPKGQQHIIRSQLDHLIERYRESTPEVPLLFAICAPCQSFTKFVQRNLTEARSEARHRDSSLLLQTVSLIDKFQPELIMSENVVGVRHGPNSKMWTQFQETLETMGYRVNCDTVCASNFGIAQYRRRSILLAIKDADEAPSIPTVNPIANPETVNSIIGDLPPLRPGESVETTPNHRCNHLTDINQERLLAVPPGGSNKNFPPRLMLECHRRLADGDNPGFGDVYTRMVPDQPAPTITTRFNSVSNGRFGHYDAAQSRGLSLHEGALLQSFRGDYVFYGNSTGTIARMIGNAVPPKLAEFMAAHLHQTWSAGNGTTRVPEQQINS